MRRKNAEFVYACIVGVYLKGRSAFSRLLDGLKVAEVQRMIAVAEQLRTKILIEHDDVATKAASAFAQHVAAAAAATASTAAPEGGGSTSPSSLSPPCLPVAPAPADVAAVRKTLEKTNVLLRAVVEHIWLMKSIVNVTLPAEEPHGLTYSTSPSSPAPAASASLTTVSQSHTLHLNFVESHFM